MYHDMYQYARYVCRNSYVYLALWCGYFFELLKTFDQGQVDFSFCFLYYYVVDLVLCPVKKMCASSS